MAKAIEVVRANPGDVILHLDRRQAKALKDLLGSISPNRCLDLVHDNKAEIEDYPTTVDQLSCSGGDLAYELYRALKAAL